MNDSQDNPEDNPEDDSGRLGFLNRLRVQMFKSPGLDSAAGHEVIDLTLLEPDDPTEAVRRKLTLVDEPVQGSRREPESRGSLLGGKPVPVGMSHAVKANTLSSPLNPSQALLRYKRRIRAQSILDVGEDDHQQGRTDA